MKRLNIEFVLLLLIICLAFTGLTMAQDAKPTTPETAGKPAADAKPLAELKLSDENDKLRIQSQLLLQENATLRKQLAQAQRQLGEANAQLAEVNDQAVQTGGGQLLKQIADRNKLDLSLYDFKIGTNDKGETELKFVLKPEPKK